MDPLKTKSLAQACEKDIDMVGVFLAGLLILFKKGGLLQLKFGGVRINIYLWAQ